VKAFAGRDATEAFLSYHRKKFPHEKVSSYLVGKAIPAKASPDADKDYLELCGIIEQVLPRSRDHFPFNFPDPFSLETKHLLLHLISSKHSLFFFLLSVLRCHFSCFLSSFSSLDIT
jgi:acyl-lipid (7-3)-desaturase (Delta-4 desaturase)